MKSVLEKIAWWSLMPKHIKQELIKQGKERHRKMYLASHGITEEFIRLESAFKNTANELQSFSNIAYKANPKKQKSKRPRQWTNKFYPRQT